MGRTRVRRLAFIIALACTTFARSAGAQCVILPLNDQENQWPHVAFIATVQQVQAVPAGQIVTFAVGRVYKGQVAEHVVVYNCQHSAVQEGIVTFEVAKRYLVLAHRQTPEEREQFALPLKGRETLGNQGCDAYPVELNSYVQDILRGAPGYPPRAR
jgi:hypothetical protein